MLSDKTDVFLLEEDTHPTKKCWSNLIHLDKTKVSLYIQIIHLCINIIIFLPSIIYSTQSHNKCQSDLTLNNYFNIGPSENLCFIGIPINTWGKYSIYLFLFILSQAISSCSTEISNAWFVNQLADEKVELPFITTMITVQLYYLNWALDNALTVFCALIQVDFLMGSMIGTSCVITITTLYYLDAKKIYKHIQI